MTHQYAGDPGSARSDPPAFVGRGRELAAVTGALADAPALVLIEGEAGIGKTRLVRECLDLLSLRELRVMHAMCLPLREPFPLGPIVDAVGRQRIGGIALSPLAGALRPLFPEWAGELPPALEPLGDPGATRHRLFRAMVELVERSGVDVLVVEDAHWADAATLEFLLVLCASRTRDISVVVTYRPTDVSAKAPLLPLTSRPVTGMTQVRVALDPLTVDETTRLVASIFATEEVSAEFVAFLHQRTQGVPLALEETVSLLRDRGDIVRRGGEWSRRALDELQVPPTVRDSVLERVAWLDLAARQILAAAAVLEESADELTLARVAALDEHVARGGLASALTSGLLHETEPGRFACRHILASKAIEEAVPASERRRLHRQAAVALQNLVPPPVTRLSRHFREAGEVGAWSQYAEAAADLALESGDDQAAVVVLHELLTAAGHPPERYARLTRKLGEAATWGVAVLGDLGTAVTATLREALAQGGIPAGERGEIRLLLGRLLLQLGEFDAATEQIEAAVPDLGPRPGLAARAMISLAFPRGQAWPASRHLEWLDRATRLLPEVASRHERRSLAVDRASALLMLGEEAGWTAADEIGEDVASLFERRQVARCLMNVGHLAIAWGRDGEARRRLDAAIALMGSTGYERLMNSAKLTRAYLDLHSGTWGGLADRVAQLADAMDTLPEAHLEARLTLALLDMAYGRRAAAEQQLRGVLAGATRRGLIDVQSSPAAAIGRLRLAEDDVADAIRVTEPGMTMIARKGMWLWATDLAAVRVDALVRAGRQEAAEALVREYAAGLANRDAPAPQAALQLCRGIVADARGDHEDAAAWFGRAARSWSALPRPYSELLAAERQGRSLLHVAGRHDEALSLLGTVQQRLHELGARWDGDRVAHLLRRHGVEVARVWRGGRRGYGDRLSPRELEVARLVTQGLTNRQAAEALFLSPRTVDRHLSAAMRKLGVASRTALAVAFTDPGDGPADDTGAGKIG